MKDLHTTFEYMRSKVRLSDAEKDAVRGELMAFMQERPMLAPVPSPLQAFLVSPFLRYSAAALLLLVMGSGGVAYAAMDAAPADALYAVRVKVTEPVQVALTLDPKDRADLEVELVNERLKEVAEASVSGALTPGQVALVTSSLSDHIDGAQGAVAALHEDHHPDDALDTAGSLEATLSAHAAILDKVQDAHPDVAGVISPIVTTVSSELTQTSDLVDASQAAVEQVPPPDESADEQASNTAEALSQVRNEVTAALASYDASDRKDINESLAGIQSIISEAQAKDAAGDSGGAYLLYTEASQQLTALQLAIEADQALQIDTIDATSTQTDN
jgi:hypothetical protein